MIFAFLHFVKNFLLQRYFQGGAKQLGDCVCIAVWEWVGKKENRKEESTAQILYTSVLKDMRFSVAFLFPVLNCKWEWVSPT